MINSVKQFLRILVCVIFIGIIYLFAQTLIFSVNNTDDKNNDNNYRNYVAENYKIYSLATPEGLDFAGEQVKLNDIDIRERLDKELIINTYWHSQTLFMIKRANRWFPVIEKILKEQNIPDDFKYLALIESNLDYVVSPAGASGFWQFLKSTGQNYGLEINSFVDERYNLEKATLAACKYFKDAYAVFKNWTLAAASYNMGIAGLQQKLKEQGVNNYYDLYLNQETHRYVFRILAAKEIFKNPAYYGFNVRPKDLYQPYLTVDLNIDSTVNNLSEFAQKHQTNLKILKLLNPWLRDNKLPNPHKKNYTIKLPEKEFNLKPMGD
jgi:hypothetical protein